MLSVNSTKKNKRNPQEKIRLFRRCFSGLENVYGTYDIITGQVRQVKTPVTDKVILDHLTGRQPYGVYLLTGETIKALAVDFDQDNLQLPAIFLCQARQLGIPAYVERSKSKGFHVWIFFDAPVSARKARQVAQKILLEMGKPETEIFPKQDALNDQISYGNFINAPLFGKLACQGRTVFADPQKLAIPYPDQWALLATIKRVSEAQLDAIIKSSGINEQALTVEKPQNHRPSNSHNRLCSFGLPPCGQKMLAEGVDGFQRVSCFRLAVHLKRSGLPFDLALAVLTAWAKKNRPGEGKQVITTVEIEQQTRCAYENYYRSLGCAEPAIARYCDQNCPVHVHRTATNPT